MIYYRYNLNHISIMGQTYPHREVFKSFGGVFISNRKLWQVPYSQENLSKINDFCLTKGGGPLEESPKDSDPIQSKLEAVKNPISRLSIAQLYTKIESIFSTHLNSYYWIMGELENISIKTNGIYLTLAEKKDNYGGDGSSATVGAILWQERFKFLSKKYGKEIIEGLFQEGMKVCVKAELRFYKGRGNVSLLLLDIDPVFTKGDLALKREAVVKTLRAKKLYEQNKKLSLGAFPFRIGLVSAKESRAYSDFCHQLNEGGFCGEVLFVPCAMQGATLASELRKSVDLLQRKDCDLIVITRGGGSAADLRWFDSYDAARVVTDCKIPVIAAIGHHEDICIVEEVAFVHVKTPTAAAVFIKQWFQKTLEKIKIIEKALESSLNSKTLALEKRYKKNLNELSFLTKKTIEKNTYEIKSFYLSFNRVIDEKLRYIFIFMKRIESAFADIPYGKIRASQLVLDKINISLMHSIEKFLAHLMIKLEKTSSDLLQKDPKPWLSKGWSRLYRLNSAVKSISDVKLNETLEAFVTDGVLTLEVKKIKKEIEYEKK